MTTPTNFLQQVQTYQMAHLAFQLNYSAFIYTANKKFKDFNKLTANLGDTVTYESPPRMVAQDGLVANWQGVQQLVRTLTVDKAKIVPYAFTAQQFIFNVEEYMKRFGMSAVAEISTAVEADVATLAETHPYRFYGDGITAINSFGQLASMLALYRTYGYAHSTIKVYLPDTVVPSIVNSGMNQFTPNRNNELAQSWMVGNWNGVEFYQSNLLPVHTAGTCGEDQLELTVVSTNDPTGANITQITLSGAGASDADAVKKYDKFRFVFNVSGQPNQFFLTYVGHKPSAAPAQFMATADAASTGGGQVTVNITPALCSQAGNPNQNLSYNVVAGMKVKALPSFRAGLVVGGDALFVAMPQLPEQTPFPTANHMDEETGVSVRLTYGSVFGQNQMGFTNDCIWGKDLNPPYAMTIAFPLNVS